MRVQRSVTPLGFRVLGAALVRPIGRLNSFANLTARCIILAAFAGLDHAAAAASVYPKMASISAYLMNHADEVALAKSAAPISISKHATVLVLTRTGYEIAVHGTNGFVCWVGRAFSGAFDWAERWNPKIRAAECENPQAVRSIMPIAKLHTEMALAGRTNAEIISRIRAALSSKEIPPVEPGAMSYMMSKFSYLTDEEHDMPHLMFFVPVNEATDWGANLPDTPVIGGNYWFFTPGPDEAAAGLPPLTVFIVAVSIWSDGTSAPAHRM